MTLIKKPSVTLGCSRVRASLAGWTIFPVAMALLAVAIATTLALAGRPASAQVKFAPDQCAAALSIAEEIEDSFDISPRLKASFERFRRSRCDVDTRFERDTEVDVKAFLEFRLKFEMWRTCNDNPIRRGCQPQ
jgi:hypothetical protein